MSNLRVFVEQVHANSLRVKLCSFFVFRPIIPLRHMFEVTNIICPFYLFSGKKIEVLFLFDDSRLVNDKIGCFLKVSDLQDFARLSSKNCRLPLYLTYPGHWEHYVFYLSQSNSGYVFALLMDRLIFLSKIIVCRFCS